MLRLQCMSVMPQEGNSTLSMSSERCNAIIKTVFEKAGVIYLVTKLVKDPNLVSALTSHVEGSRKFTRYRTIDINMKKDLSKILGGKQ